MQLDKLQKSLMKKEEIGGRIIDVIKSSNQIIILVLAKLDIKGTVLEKIIIRLGMFF